MNNANAHLTKNKEKK